ncbi:MAG: hypothetical protein ACK4SM_06410 [Aquificaceae bacterium]
MALQQAKNRRLFKIHSRRGRKLNIQLPKTNSKNTHLLIDSSCIKVHGDGEWKAYKHGREKKITDEKVHDSKA